MKQANTTRYIVGLDVARIVCAAIVVFYHLGYAIWDGASPFRPQSRIGHLILRLISAGWVGVPVFFMISGFVIAYSARDAAPITFLRHRLVRLVPGMMICGTTTAVVVLATRSMSLAQTVTAWSHSVTFRLSYPYIDPSHWTLPVEVLFYALVFLALLFNQRRRLATWIALLGCGSTVYGLLLGMLRSTHWHHKALSGLTAINALVSTNDVSLVIYGIYFALGAALYSLLVEKRWDLCVLCTPVFLFASYFQMDYRNDLLGVIGVEGGSALLAYELVVLAFLLMICAIRFNEAISRVMGDKAKRVCRRLGLMTYPLYLIHQEIGKQFIIGTHLHSGDRLAVIAAIVLVSALAFVISTWLEPPFSRQLRGLLEREA